MKFIKSDALTIANKLGAQASQRRRHEQWLVTGAAVLIVKRSTGATLCHCATLGEVLAFLIGYDACRKDVPEGLDDDGP